MANNTDKSRYFKELVTVVIGIAIALLPPPAGLEAKAMIFLGILAWAVMNWVITPMPTYASGLIMLALFALFKLVPFPRAFGAYSGGIVWLILCVLLIGTAVSKSGLLSRVCLMIMKICPPTFRGQMLALLAGGCLIGPLMPSTTAKVAIAGPFATRIGELLGLKERSRGLNGLYLAMQTGFCLMAPMFITCSFWGYLLTGQLSAEEGALFTFIGWFKAMLPWSVFTLVASYISLVVLYRPSENVGMDRASVQKMLDDLGPMKRDEKITILVVLACLACWVLERQIGVAAVIPAVLAIGVLTFLKVLTPKDLNGTNWGLVLFVGQCSIISSIIAAVKLDTWLAAQLGPVIGNFASNPYLFITAIAAAVMLVRLLIYGSSVIVLFMVLLTPVCHAAHVNPWVAGIISYVMMQTWFMRYMNPPFLGAFEAAGGDAKLDYNGTLPYCFVFHAIALIGLLVCVPFWKGMGILP
ncbi:MAG: anion permease [Pyramidobacter sp.]|nr:anion permease [Pyramidobacter sp.]